MHPSVTRVQEALADAGLSTTVRVLDAPTPTALAAATLLGCDVGAIANSLVFTADDVPILVMTSGAHRIDTSVLAENIGAQHIGRATPDQVRDTTGQPIGGVAPVGHPSPMRTYIDVALREYDELWAAGGIPASLFGITYDDLVRVTNGTEVAVSR
ncbi:YbaK/EbsC family protein [Demequina aurantiaca]|uniref:YbaK/EbsC family protein n=1 Tax=Demequina aurantiaca TaxID=676200 RepID=UPI000781BC8F|nr:YbaK/EbsC family protein [Demequina aurantiaca]